MGYGVGGICAWPSSSASSPRSVRIPSRRRDLERRVLSETSATVIADDSHKEVRNLLEGLAIAAGIPPPRYAVIDERRRTRSASARSRNTPIVAVTTGLCDDLSRDELEAVLAYEVHAHDPQLRRRAGELDRLGARPAARSLHSTVTAAWCRASSASSRVGSRSGCRCGHCATRAPSATGAAVRFTATPRRCCACSRSSTPTRPRSDTSPARTAPLWIEFPAHILAGSPTRATRRLSESLLLDERIDALRTLAHLEATTPANPVTPA